MEPEGSLPHSQASATRPYPGPCLISFPLICAMHPLETPPPPGDPSGGVVYLQVVLSPEEASCLWVFCNMSFLLCGVVSPTANPQPGGPGYPLLSGSSHLTCLAWEALPVAYATASIALGIMWPRKPHHYVKVAIPSGGPSADIASFIEVSRDFVESFRLNDEILLNMCQVSFLRQLAGFLY
jgi:hypothetical protein